MKMKGKMKNLNNSKRKIHIVALTAIRSEYDLLYPLLKAMAEDKKFKVQVIVAGAHLTKLHNYSYKNIERDGFHIIGKIKNFKMNSEGNSILGRVKGAAYLLDKLSEILSASRPDLFIYLGDREEPLMGAVAANYLGIPSVHIAGGDNAHPIGGDVDEEARHATTKLSHIHLTMASAHEKRILAMGEESWRVKTVGNPGLDRLRMEAPVQKDKMKKILGVGILQKYIVLIYHAVSSDTKNAPIEFERTIQECIRSGLHVFIGSPNSDPGYIELVKVAKKYCECDQVTLYKNLPRGEFVTLLKGAEVIVGNSSLGLLEASYIGVPAINVGQRQRGRLAGINVQFVNANRREIREALKKALYDGAYRVEVKREKSIYGDGHMVKKTINFLKKLPERKKLLDKRITY